MSNFCESLFQTYSVEDFTNAYIAYLPGGDLFDAKNIESSVLRGLFSGLAVEIKRASDDMNMITSDYDIYCTENLLSRWESALGIPDQCFDGTGTLEQRRQQVLIKLASLGVSTAKGFIDLAALFGFKILIPSAATYGVFPLSFPAAFYQYPQDARFTMLVIVDADQQPQVFPFDVIKYPIPFFSDLSNVIECLFTELAPANVDVQFRYVKLS